MKAGTLFFGIGGLDLGLERAGFDIRWQSEIDPYACRVLAKHWPSIPNLGDVKEIDWSTVEPVDLICGGYPCQPFSLAGTRNGTEDPRHLWPYFAGALRSLRPEWALLENVPGRLSLGFDDVQADLAELGYDTEWECIPAAAVGAPHLRYRLFVVAHAQRGQLREQPVSERWGSGTSFLGDYGQIGDVADADGAGRGEQRGTESDGAPRPTAQRCGEDVADATLTERRTTKPQGVVTSTRRTTESRECFGGARSIVSQWSPEPDVGRVANGISHRVDRLRGLGNAVVPQVAEWVGRRILEAAA